MLAGFPFLAYNFRGFWSFRFVAMARTLSFTAFAVAALVAVASARSLAEAPAPEPAPWVAPEFCFGLDCPEFELVANTTYYEVRRSHEDVPDAVLQIPLGRDPLESGAVDPFARALTPSLSPPPVAA